MNTKQFQYVLTLAHEGSFSKAASILNITQPSLSQYIKKIETDIGMELFDRTNGGISLTDAGKVYIEAGRKILDLERQMENSFMDLQACKTGSIVIGTTPYQAASMLPEIAKAFKLLYPGIQIVVREGNTGELSEAIERGEYDFALTVLPLDQQIFSYEKVMEEEMVLAVPSGFPPFPSVSVPGRRFDVIDIHDLNKKSMVMLTDTHNMQKLLDNLMTEFKLKVYPAIVVKSIETQIEMVKAGIGMAIMPSGIERYCKSDGVVFYSFAMQLPKREVVVMWRKDRMLSKAAIELKGLIHSIEW